MFGHLDVSVRTRVIVADTFQEEGTDGHLVGRKFVRERAIANLAGSSQESVCMRSVYVQQCEIKEKTISDAIAWMTLSLGQGQTYLVQMATLSGSCLKGQVDTLGHRPYRQKNIQNF